MTFELKSFEFDRINMAYVDEGLERGRGECLVFLHGFPLSHAMWSSQIDAFAKTHRVIVPDLRGHGGSTVTEGTVTMRDMADDVAKLLSALDVKSPITLCGLSMGGYVAWEFWRSHRELLGRLILCDTRAVADTEEVARGRHMMAAQVIDAGAQMAADSMPSKLLGEQAKAQPELVESVRSMILETDPQGIAATQRGMSERTDMTSQLAKVEVPTLVLCGAEDVISPPEEMQQFASAMPNATFVKIANAGHLAPLEQPSATNDAIRSFLGTHDEEGGH